MIEVPFRASYGLPELTFLFADEFNRTARQKQQNYRAKTDRIQVIQC